MPKSSPNVKKNVRISLVFWYGFRDLGSKMDANLVQFVVKIVVRRANVIFCESACFIGPAEVPEGLDPPNMFQNR